MQMHFHIMSADVYLDSSAVSSRQKPSLRYVRFSVVFGSFSGPFNIGFVFPVQVMSY